MDWFTPFHTPFPMSPRRKKGGIPENLCFTHGLVRDNTQFGVFPAPFGSGIQPVLVAWFSRRFFQMEESTAAADALHPVVFRTS
jgi:hypothetical protein